MKEIAILNIKVPTKREEVCNKENISKLIESIKDLDKMVLVFDTEEQMKESKKFRTNANKFIAEFKEFCDPLEEEGKTIAKTRSEVKLTLERIVDAKLKPIDDTQKKFTALKDKLFIPSNDINHCKIKLAELDALKDFEWFWLKEEAATLINQSKNYLENELLGFEKASREKAEAEEKLRIEREEAIKLQAKKEAEEAAQKLIDAANIQVEEAKKQIEEIKQTIHKPTFAVKSVVNSDKEHQAKIHNEILEDLDFYEKDFLEFRKEVIRKIVSGKIRNLKIVY